jgi:hypothetical protein
MLSRFDQNYTPDGHTYILDFCLLWDLVIAYRLILFSSYIVFCTHILIDGCHGIPPHCRISYYLAFYLSRRTLTIPSTSPSHTFCATYIHLGSSTVLPVHAWYPQVYAALVCQATTFPPLFYLREKKYHRVGIWRPRRFSCSLTQIPYVRIPPHWARLSPFRVRVSNCD